MEVRGLMRTRLTLIAVLVVAALAANGCGPKMVKVETGEKVDCVYGHTVSSSVHVIEVPADKAGDYGVVSRLVTCGMHKALEKLYAEAQAAIAAGDMAGAKSSLAQIVAKDARFKRAADQLAQIEAGKKPAPDRSGSPGSGGSGKQPVGPIESLTGWVPDKLAGYKADPILADAMQVSREYVPTGAGRIESLVIVVEQYRNAADAKAARATGIERDYSVGRATVSVKGRSLYFGTDGGRFGIVAWNEGGLLIAIEASARDRRPEGLRQPLADVAGMLIR